MPWSRRQQAFGARSAGARGPVRGLSRARAQRLQERPPQQPDHERLRRAALEAGHRGPRRLVLEPAADGAARPALRSGPGPELGSSAVEEGPPEVIPVLAPNSDAVGFALGARDEVFPEPVGGLAQEDIRLRLKRVPKTAAQFLFELPRRP